MVDYKHLEQFVDDTHTPELQAARGARNSAEKQRIKAYKSHEVRRESAKFKRERALQLHSDGVKQKIIAERLGINQSTISRWIKYAFAT